MLEVPWAGASHSLGVHRWVPLRSYRSASLTFWAGKGGSASEFVPGVLWSLLSSLLSPVLSPPLDPASQRPSTACPNAQVPHSCPLTPTLPPRTVALEQARGPPGPTTRPAAGAQAPVRNLHLQDTAKIRIKRKTSYTGGNICKPTFLVSKI